MFRSRRIKTTWRIVRLVGVLSLAAGLTELVGLPDAAAITSSSGSVNINDFLGAERFYDAGYTGTRTIQANIEAGHIWNGHSTLGHVTTRVTGTGALGTNNSHATSVGAAMGGRPTSGEYPTDLRSWGIAYGAETWSGAIATAFGSGITFSLTNNSVASTYSPILQSGVGGMTADVFNSSWGSTDSMTGADTVTRGIDGLINANGTIGVFAAGNEGPSANTVFSPGSGYNAITVGALAFGTSTTRYQSVPNFSSRGPNDFAMATSPTSTTVISGVRAAVDLVAPGQTLTLANLNSSSNPTGYSSNNAGTSFAAPLVAGGASLVVDAGKDLYAGNANAIDGRVVKSVLLNSADKTPGWNNGQLDVEGVIRTTQSLDWKFGAGRMNLDRAFDQYVAASAGGMAGTTDLAGLGGGDVEAVGWDFARVNSLGSNTYFIDQQLEGGTNLSTTLSWFADRNTGSLSSFSGASEQHLANLDVSIFQFDDLINRNIIGTVAESVSLYNVVEHLSFLTPVTGYFGIQVAYAGAHWNFTNETGETYGLAWSSTPLATVAGDRFWINPAGGDFGTANNWSPNQTPGLVDNAVFDLGGSYVVDFSDEFTNQELRVANGFVTFNLQGNSYILTSSSALDPSIRVDSTAGGEAHLLLGDGALHGANAVVGESVGSSAEVVVGAGAVWTNSGEVVVGRQGHGTIDVQNGGLVSSAGVTLGDEADSAGTVIVDGVGSTWTLDFIRVGNLGAGEMNILNGGLVISNSDSYIGYETDSSGTANIAGSGAHWSISESLFVGGSDVGAGGEGTLVITDDASATVTGELHVWSSGTVTVGSEDSVGMLEATGGVTIDGGLLQVGAGSNVTLGSGMTMSVTEAGTLQGSGAVTGIVNNLGGVVAPGSSIGTLTIAGDYTQSDAGTLSIEIAGTTPGSEIDRLVVEGVATLDGTLEISFASFSPILGDPLEIVAASGGVTGIFDEPPSLAMEGGLVWRMLYEATSVALVATLPGDFNGDGSVDAADYTVWRNHFGDPTEAAIAYSGDGESGIDENDYALWKQHYGTTYTLGSGGFASAQFSVPEASTLTLLATACFLAAACRRTRRLPPILRTTNCQQ